VADVNQLALCEGLLRCADALVAKGDQKGALAIYERLYALKVAHQVSAAGLRGALLTKQQEGVELLRQTLRGDDFAMVEAAAKVCQDVKCPEVTKVLAEELPKLNADKQILLCQALGKRHDATALPALSALAKSGEKEVRLAAIRSLAEIADAKAIPILTELQKDEDKEINRAVERGLNFLQS
jgi:HEAT repeat protein